MDRVFEYDFHPPDDLRLFRYDWPGVLRFDETLLIAEADYHGTLLRHYAFADHWFKINCTTDRRGSFVEEKPDPELAAFCFNCDIATPMVRRDSAVFGVDLWLDVLVRSDGVTYEVIDEDHFARAIRHGWLSPQEADGARRGLDELVGIIERKQLISFLSELHAFRSTAAPPAIKLERVPVADFPIVHAGRRPTW